MASTACRTGGNMRGGFSGRHFAIVAAVAAGSRTTVVKVRRRPCAAAVAITAGVAARQMLGRFGARGDRAAGHVATFAELGRLLENPFDVAGFALRLFMRTGQRESALVVIEARLAVGGGIARTDQCHAQQREADKQQCRPTGKRITLSLFMHGRSPLESR